MRTIRFVGEPVDSSTSRISMVNIRWPDLAPLAALTQLRQLELTHTNPHRPPGTLTVDLMPLRSLRTLEVLNLPEYAIRDLSPLRGLHRLRTLHLDFTQVADLEPLAGLTSLRSLHLRASRITDLTALAAMDDLQDLDIAHTGVADLRPLYDLPALRSLDVTGSPVSPAGVAAFERIRPDVTVAS